MAQWLQRIRFARDQKSKYLNKNCKGKKRVEQQLTPPENRNQGNICCTK